LADLPCNKKKDPKEVKNAKSAIRAVREGAKQLQDYPEAGRSMGDRTGRRELFVTFGVGGYVLRYVLDEQTVVVIRVWHAREKRRTGFLRPGNDDRLDLQQGCCR